MHASVWHWRAAYSPQAAQQVAHQAAHIVDTYRVLEHVRNAVIESSQDDNSCNHGSLHAGDSRCYWWRHFVSIRGCCHCRRRVTHCYSASARSLQARSFLLPATEALLPLIPSNSRRRQEQHAVVRSGFAVDVTHFFWIKPSDAMTQWKNEWWGRILALHPNTVQISSSFSGQTDRWTEGLSIFLRMNFVNSISWTQAISIKQRSNWSFNRYTYHQSIQQSIEQTQWHPQALSHVEL
jgi:hypothetical protein